MNAVELALAAEQVGGHGRVLVLHEHVAVIQRDAQVRAVCSVENHAGHTHGVDERVRALLVGFVLNRDLEVGRVVANLLECGYELVEDASVGDLEAVVKAVVAEPDGHRVATGSAAVVARLVAELKGFRGKGIIGIAQVTVEEGVAEAQRAAVQLQVVSCELGGHVLSRDTCAVLGVVEVDVREAHALELREHAIKILAAIAKIGVDTSCKLHASTSFTFVLDRFCPFEHLIYIRNSIRAAACAPGLTL